MKIERKRWIVMRNNRTEVLCGLARAYEFKPVDQIGNTAIKSYRSEKQALAAFWTHYFIRNVEVVPVLESVEVLEE